MRRVKDSRVHWTATLPVSHESFDRILCGAAIWQMHPLPETLRVLANLLHSGGALCFDIPAMYLMEPDEPGGGDDPMLLDLPALIHDGRRISPPADAGDEVDAVDRLSMSSLDTWLNAAGLKAQSWSFRIRMTQQAYADWLRIPALTDRLLGGIAPQERSRRIDAALELVDRSSWKWERWRGWTAWKE
jgi:hypothetical protein